MRRLLVLVCCLAAAAAHESCCAKKARLAKLRKIPDPNAEPPEVDAYGRPRLIASDGTRPSGWDDEDDGPWEPPLVANPQYSWNAPLIDNPDYRPPTLLAEFQGEVLRALPWLVIGVLIAAAAEASPLSRMLGSFLRGAGPLKGALFGLATPLCSCGALPVAVTLLRGGVPLRAVVAFLTATQSAGLDSAAITWGLLGPAAALWRLVGAFVLAVAAGLAAPARVKAAGAAWRLGCGDRAPPRVGGGCSALLRTAFVAAAQSAADTFPPVLLGLLLSAGVTRFVPLLPNAPHELGGASGLPARLALLAASVPLQLCEHSTVTAAATIQRMGSSVGLSFAFLLAAPATNLPSLLLLFRAAPRFAVARVSAALGAAALLLSYAVDALALELLVEQEAATSLALPAWFIEGSPWIAAPLAAAALAQAVGVWPSPSSADECCATGPEGVTRRVTRSVTRASCKKFD
jgi:hypothetical protein